MATRTRPCEVCRRLIEPERAEGVADTRLCVDCARRIARYGGEFLLTASQDRIGKAESLKRMYGGVTPKKTRNTLGIARLRREIEEEQQAGRADRGGTAGATP